MALHRSFIWKRPRVTFRAPVLDLFFLICLQTLVEKFTQLPNSKRMAKANQKADLTVILKALRKTKAGSILLPPLWVCALYRYGINVLINTLRPSEFGSEVYRHNINDFELGPKNEPVWHWTDLNTRSHVDVQN
jgi:hypothetical protein